MIATQRAVAGLDVHDGVDCIVAGPAKAAEFASGAREASCVTVHRSSAASGRRLAVEHYSIEALSRLLAP